MCRGEMDIITLENGNEMVGGKLIAFKLTDFTENLAIMAMVGSPLRTVAER